MIKSNLPVILLKGLVLLPHEEARIELNNNINIQIADTKLVARKKQKRIRQMIKLF